MQTVLSRFPPLKVTSIDPFRVKGQGVLYCLILSVQQLC